MNRRLRILLVLVAAAALLVLGWRWFGPAPSERTLSGYVEGETLFLAAPVAGTVASLSAVEGARVEAGQQVFTIDPAELSAERQQARAQASGAVTRISAAQANVQQAAAESAAAAADLDRARRDLDRLLAVQREDAAAVAGRDIDTARAAVRQARAQLQAVRKRIEAQRAQVAAARAEAAQAEGGERQVQVRLGRLSPAAPAAGRVERIYYQRGEWVPANRPVVGLLPDGQVRVRFFVPEEEIARYRPGRLVAFTCDSCPPGQSARISFVSARPEFTPPIIFSRESRDRLVFMVEAVPARPARLVPGLPVEVRPLP